MLTALTEAGGNLFYFGIEYAIGDIGLGYGIDNLILGSTEMIMAGVLTGFVVRLPRKKTIIISYWMVSGLSFLFMVPSIANSVILVSIIIIGIRALTSTIFVKHSIGLFHDYNDSNIIISFIDSIDWSWIN